MTSNDSLIRKHINLFPLKVLPTNFLLVSSYEQMAKILSPAFSYELMENIRKQKEQLPLDNANEGKQL